MLIQCPFECEKKEHSHMVHGETLKISFGCEGCIYIS